MAVEGEDASFFLTGQLSDDDDDVSEEVVWRPGNNSVQKKEWRNIWRAPTARIPSENDGKGSKDKARAAKSRRRSGSRDKKDRTSGYSSGDAASHHSLSSTGTYPELGATTWQPAAATTTTPPATANPTPVSLMDALKKCITKGPACNADAFNLPAAVASLDSAKAAVAHLTAVLQGLIKQMKASHVNNLAAAAWTQIRTAEAQRTAAEQKCIKEPSWAAAAQVQQLELSLIAAAKHFGASAAAINQAAKERCSQTASDQKTTDGKIRAEAKALAQEVLTAASEFVITLRRVLSLLSKMENQALEKPVRDLMALYDTVQNRRDALKQAAAGQEMEVLITLRAAMAASGKTVRNLCDKAAAQGAAPQQDKEEPLRDLQGRLEKQLHLARQQEKTARKNIAVVQKKVETGGGTLANMDMLLQEEVSAKEQAAAEQDNIARISKQLDEIRGRADLAASTKLLAETQDACALVRSFSGRMAELWARVEDCHARTVQLQDKWQYKTDLCEQLRNRGMQAWIAKYDAFRGAAMDAFFKRLSGIFKDETVLLPATEESKPSFAAMMDVVMLHFKEGKDLYERFHQLSLDFTKANETLVRAKLEVLFANIFLGTKKAEDLAAKALQRGL
jgi:hypothetical protein